MKNFKEFIGFKRISKSHSIFYYLFEFKLDHTKTLKYLNKKYKNKNIKISKYKRQGKLKLRDEIIYAFGVTFILSKSLTYILKADKIVNKNGDIYLNTRPLDIVYDEISLIEETEIIDRKDIDPLGEEDWEEDNKIDIIKKFRTGDSGPR